MPNPKFLVILLAIIPEALMESTLTPLFPFMARELLPGGMSDIGYYSGLLGSAFYLPL
jgi:hypothetical protein